MAPAADLVALRDSGGKTALHYCVENPNTEPVELLLSLDQTLINVHDDHGHSALHLAAVAGNVHVVKCLLQHGADINTRDKDEHSVVHWATGLYYDR
jgi:ankyrin repeat protein